MLKYNEYEQTLADEMIKLGLHISNRGFNYLLHAIIIILDTDDIKMSELYELISERTNKSYNSVEKCIRAEILSFYNRNANVPQELTPDEFTGILCNSEFVHRLAYAVSKRISGKQR